MKKYMILICIVMTLCFCSCNTEKGDISSVKITDNLSQVYTKEDIDNAIDVAMEYFEDEFSGCKLTEIEYAGDELIRYYEDWANRNNADEVIVLRSSFDVDSSGGDGSLEADSTYKDWNWILVRNEDGDWVHVDHGY